MGDYDRRELTDDKGVMLRAALKGWQSNLWTALPGMVTKFNAALQTCEIKPTIKASVLDSKGQTTWVELPLLLDCPVIFPSGGGYTLTFPIVAGDEVLVIFASRCIDSWWQSGGIQVQAELRMHDLSDGFVLPGPKSIPNVLPSLSATDVQLRNWAGTTTISIKPDGKIELVSPEEVDVVAPQVRITGNLTVTGAIIAGGKVTADDFATPALPSYKVHNHGGVTTGGGFTSIPFPGS